MILDLINDSLKIEMCKIPKTLLRDIHKFKLNKKKTCQLIVRSHPTKKLPNGITINDLRKCARKGGVVLLEDIPIDYLKCTICNSGNDEANMLICDSCSKGYHIYCLRPILPYIPTGDWHCPNCLKPKVQYKRHINKKEIFNFLNISDTTKTKDKIEKPKKKSLFHVECRQIFRVHIPSESPEKREKQMFSLADALYSKNLDFGNELCYNCPESMNNSKYERDTPVQVMTNINKIKFKKYKELCNMGLFPPLLVCEDKDQGYIVKADERILDKTILAEYIGNVYPLSESENKDSDGVMELIRAKSKKSSLTIIPETVGNIGFLLSGINNTKQDLRKKQVFLNALYIIIECKKCKI